ncbi:uncharacterized protein RCO7_05983 [Rhynchosporium graminicola]|uniref:Glycosyltransferase family 71 protein n=1 Tax=Rhynchosporium graminicola TaxID=2792576 RepID=A0A1E1L080_9HELO|nr:uncharacterized protein RCO7_05983 [Rhynchosporium commune]
MFSSVQRPRLLVASWFVLGALYFVYISLHNDFEDYIKIPYNVIFKPSSPSAKSNITAFVENAHTLPDADAYLPHFNAVILSPNVTLAEAKRGCTWEDSDGVNFMYSGDAEWVKQERNDTELAVKRSEWQTFISTKLMPYSRYSERFSGRGIVIVAGNERTMKRVKVLLRALQTVNCSLPVEIHFYGDEVPPQTQKDLIDLYPTMTVFFNDLASRSNIIKTGFNAFVANFQFKTAAVLNSRFAEVLLLDSDNIPAFDPEELFVSNIYEEYGTIFWPDIARTRPNNPIWSITNTICKMDEYEQESGQLLVDKRRFFYHLQLAAWLNGENASYYNMFLLGDKDMFRFAWHALKTRYGRPTKWLTSVGTLTEGKYCGHTFAQHHPDPGDDRIVFLHGGLLKQIPNEVVKWQKEERGGVYQAYKRSNVDEKWGEVQKCGMEWENGDYVPDERVDRELPVWSCIEMFGVEPKPVYEVLGGFEGLFEGVGGYWMLDD